MADGVDLEHLTRRAKQLTRNRNYKRVSELLSGISRDIVVADPELTLMLASAWSYLFRNAAAKQLLLDAAAGIRASRVHSIARRWQNLMAIQLIREGQINDAERLLLECLGSAERDSHLRLVAYASNGLGIVASLRGEVEGAIRWYRRMLAASQQLGDRFGVGTAHHNLGLVLREWGRWHDSVSHFRLAEEYFGSEGTPEERVFTTSERAMLSLAIGDFPLAERLARGAVEKAYQLGSPFLTGTSLRVLGAILLAASQTTEARIHLENARKLSAFLESNLLNAEIYEELAMVELVESAPELAEEHKITALGYYRRLGSENHCSRFESRFRACGGGSARLKIAALLKEVHTSAEFGKQASKDFK
ncbi:MAG: tetratricopeptide repeat protein [Gemmatimonadota bacterium]